MTSKEALAEETVSLLMTEKLLTLTEARAELQTTTGRRHDKATLWRWITQGCRGNKLEAMRLGNQWMTSRQALTRFIVKINTEQVSK